MQSGSRLGPYEIVDRLGAGGMGEVYLAEDTRLGRRVAIKVLPERFVADPERLARFEQEARAAAALSHPHIAVVHDVGVEGEGPDRVHFMVQEHLRGSSLRDELASGPLPLSRALELAAQIAAALRAAHAAGIVHRDLKPDNVFITEEGHAKVLDFGLAKLTEAAGAGAGSESMSPTMVGTRAGEIMGTAGYMAPEQAEGRDVDHRADLFSFGCLLYEMTTGRQPFAGESVYDTLHRIGHAEPTPLDDIDPALPVTLRWVVAKCLAKDPDGRYQGAADLVVDVRRLAREVETGESIPLAAARAAGAVGAATSENASPGAAAGRRWSSVAALSLAAATALVVAAAAWALLPLGAPGDLALSISTAHAGAPGPPAISPDGRTVVYSVDGEDTPLYVRDLGSFQARELDGTAGAEGPFLSPDGRQVGFFRGRDLLVVPLQGGPLRTLCEGCFQFAGGATWSPDGRTVVFSSGPLFTVPAIGGEPELLTAPDSERGHLGYLYPQFLPGGDRVVVESIGSSFMTERALGVIDLADGSFRSLGIDGLRPMYSRSGHLAFTWEGSLRVVPFDADAGEVRGPARPVIAGIGLTGFGLARTALSASGVLVYQPGEAQTAGYGLSWVDVDGAVESMRTPARGNTWSMPRVSPDAARIAVVVEAETPAVFTYEVAQQVLQPVAENASNPLWSPDGGWLYFALDNGDDLDIYRQRVNSSVAPEAVVEAPGDQVPTGLSSDGALLLFDQDSEDDSDVWVVAVDGTAEPTPVLASPLAESEAVFSPDGDWIAFELAQGGPTEIWVQAFPGPGERRKVSEGISSVYPVWNEAGLFYDASGTWIRVANTATDGGFVPGPRESLLEQVLLPNFRGRNYDVSADGRRLLLPRRNVAAPSSITQLNVVLDWFERLRRERP